MRLVWCNTAEMPLVPPVKGPYNPLNGHEFVCKCFRCAIFWDTKFGTMVYGAWHERNRRLKVRNNSAVIEGE